MKTKKSCPRTLPTPWRPNSEDNPTEWQLFKEKQKQRKFNSKTSKPVNKQQPPKGALTKVIGDNNKRLPKSKPDTDKVRNWAFTINNDTSDDLLMLLNDGSFRYLCFGFEVGEIKETPHIQGYIEFDEPQRRAYLKKIMPRGSFSAVVNRAKTNTKTGKEGKDNSWARNACYAIKSSRDGDMNFYEFGEPKCQGYRTDDHFIKDKLRASPSRETLKEVADRWPTQFKTGFRAYNMIKELFERPVDVLVISYEPKQLPDVCKYVKEQLEQTFFIATKVDSMKYYKEQFAIMLTSSYAVDEETDIMAYKLMGECSKFYPARIIFAPFTVWKHHVDYKQIIEVVDRSFSDMLDGVYAEEDGYDPVDDPTLSIEANEIDDISFLSSDDDSDDKSVNESENSDRFHKRDDETLTEWADRQDSKLPKR